MRNSAMPATTATLVNLSEINTATEFANLTQSDIENAGVNALRSVLSRLFSISVRDGLHGQPSTTKANAFCWH